MINLAALKERRINAFVKYVKKDIELIKTNPNIDELQKSHNNVVRTENNAFNAGASSIDLYDALCFAGVKNTDNYTN